MVVSPYTDNIGIQMNQKELTKTFTLVVSMVYTQKI